MSAQVAEGTVFRKSPVVQCTYSSGRTYIYMYTPRVIYTYTPPRVLQNGNQFCKLDSNLRRWILQYNFKIQNKLEKCFARLLCIVYTVYNYREGKLIWGSM